jgi:hypothetical protein
LKKIIFLSIITFISAAFFSDSYAQRYTPPTLSLGLTLNGQYATAEAFGDVLSFREQGNYGMKWGRGVSLNLSLGVGEKKNNRFTFMFDYNHMSNGFNKQIPFFLFSPDTPSTVYDIYTAGLGYQYLFNAHCPHKHYLGVALTGSVINSGSGTAFAFKSAKRMGLMFQTGYEFVMDRKYKSGIVLGFRYHIVNLFGKSNGENELNDGDKPPGPGFDRTIGIIGISLGVNFYTGTKPVTRK